MGEGEALVCWVCSDGPQWSFPVELISRNSPTSNSQRRKDRRKKTAMVAKTRECIPHLQALLYKKILPIDRYVCTQSIHNSFAQKLIKVEKMKSIYLKCGLKLDMIIAAIHAKLKEWRLEH